MPESRWDICMKITWGCSPVYCTQRCVFTLCFRTFSHGLRLTCCTYREEEHAVHSKRGMTRVEGQPGEEKEIKYVIQDIFFNLNTFSSLMIQYWDLQLLPGLCDVLRLARAVDLLHVSRADLRETHGHEVRSRAADGELCQVGERLANRRPEQEGAHYFVESSYILVEVRIRVNPLAVDQISLSRGDLREKGKQRK